MNLKLRFAKLMHFCFAISFFVSGMVICGGAMTLLTIVWPFSKRLYRKLMSYLGFTMFAQPLFMLRFWATSNIKLYVDKDVYENYLGKEHSLCILNHCGELDWIVFAAFLNKFNILGNLKAYLKSTVKYIPFIGWGFHCCEFIYLSRSYEKDKSNIKKMAQNLSEYEEPISILLFPEGTRFTPKKHEDALKFSRERGFRELKHHLVPRTKGFTTSVPYMKGKIPAIYDMEIAFEDAVKPTVTNTIEGRQFNVHVYLRRIPMEDVPETEKEQDLYLRELFYRKDELMESFRKTGDFFKLSNMQPIEPIMVEAQANCFFNMIFWLIMSLLPIIYFLFKLLLNAQYFYFVIFVTCIGLGFSVLGGAIDNTKVKEPENNNQEKSDKIKSS